MSKFDPKSPTESVPNVQSKFPNRYAIRWFKCKLKPPKNVSIFVFEFGILVANFDPTSAKYLPKLFAILIYFNLFYQATFIISFS